MYLCFRGTRAADADRHQYSACSARERTAESTTKSIRVDLAPTVKRATRDSRAAATSRSVVHKPNRIAAISCDQQGGEVDTRQISHRWRGHHKRRHAPDHDRTRCECCPCHKSGRDGCSGNIGCCSSNRTIPGNCSATTHCRNSDCAWSRGNRRRGSARSNEPRRNGRRHQHDDIDSCRENP